MLRVAPSFLTTLLAAAATGCSGAAVEAADSSSAELKPYFAGSKWNIACCR